MKCMLMSVVLALMLVACGREPQPAKAPVERVLYGDPPLSRVVFTGPEYRSLARDRALYTDQEWAGLSILSFRQTGLAHYRLRDLGPYSGQVHIADHPLPRICDDHPGISIDARKTGITTLLVEHLVLDSLLLDEGPLRELFLFNLRIMSLPQIPATFETLDCMSCEVRGCDPKNVSPGLRRLRCIWGGTSLASLDIAVPSLEWLVLTSNDDCRGWGGERYALRSEKLVDVEALRGLRRLQFLAIRDAPLLSEVGAIVESPSIVDLRLERLPRLSLPSLARMHSLRGLSLEDCSLESTDFLLGLNNQLAVCLLAGNPLRRITGLARALEKGTIAVPTDKEPVMPSLTLNLERVESIDREDLELLRKLRYPGLEVLERRLSHSLACVID